MGGGAVGGSTHYACARSGPTPLRRVGAVGGLALSDTGAIVRAFTARAAAASLSVRTRSSGASGEVSGKRTIGSISRQPGGALSL